MEIRHGKKEFYLQVNRVDQRGVGVGAAAADVHFATFQSLKSKASVMLCIVDCVAILRLSQRMR